MRKQLEPTGFSGLLRRAILPITVILWGIVVISRMKFNGGILGFDYSIYQPDGANYAFRALSLLSQSDLSAANQVSSWYQLYGYKHNIINPLTLLPENSPVWHLSAPRVLYPILSIPFVSILGIPGMLVIPSLSLLGIMLIAHKIAKTFGAPELGLFFNLGLACSTTVSRWFIANLTDGLLALLVGLLIIVELKVHKKKSWIFLTTGIVLLASATRFCAPIFIALGIGYFILKERNKALTLLISGVSGAIPLFFFDTASAILPGSESRSLISKILAFPVQSLKVLFVEFAELVVLDRQFFLLVILSLFCALMAKGRIRILTFSVLFGVFTIGFINGTLGVNFRYQLPIIPFMAWSFISYFNSFLGFRRELNVVGEEAKKKLKPR